MDDIVSLVRAVLAGDKPPEEGAASLRARLGELSPGRTAAICASAYRLCRCLDQVQETGWDGEASWADVAGHLRQILLWSSQRMAISHALVSGIKPLMPKFGLRFVDNRELKADAALPSWFDQRGDIAEALSSLPIKRELAPTLGDGLLYRFNGEVSYVSGAQKDIVRVAVDMPMGCTLLACLPTGGGKSVAAQLPAFSRAVCGEKGSTVVVVPTISLALDQEKRARRSFGKLPSCVDGEPAYAYYTGMTAIARARVQAGLRDGTLPLVFCSPEAILTGSLRDTLLEASKAGSLQYLVIDEAHMVLDWGGDFRMDFQLLASYRRQLLAEGNGQLRTVLLSATLTDHATDLLRDLFSEPGHLIELRGDALRPEPVFRVDRPRSNSERKERIRELLPLLPKPLIIYVTRPEIAEMWVRWIEDEGFKRVAAFTGLTPNELRNDLLDRWRRDEIDIMVATSAFGLGVDKPDVRAIIHCCLPENVNRFYQEVGRGGRDGCLSVSLLSVVLPNDHDETFSLVNKKVLTVPKLINRWEGMRRNPAERVGGDKFWVDVGQTPEHLKGTETGDMNVRWNESALLFLYRARLIDLLQTRVTGVNGKRQVLVKLRDLATLGDQGLLAKSLETLREEEWNRVARGLERLETLVKKPTSDCWAKTFASTYPLTVEHCTGCPACRDVNRGPAILSQEAGSGQDNCPIPAPDGTELGGLLTGARELLIYVDKPYSWPDAGELQLLVHRLSEVGVPQFVVPDSSPQTWQTWVPSLPGDRPCWFVSFSETRNRNWLDGLVAVVYPCRAPDDGMFLRWSRNYLSGGLGRRVVHIAPRELFIPSEGKKLSDLVDGVQTRATRLLEMRGDNRAV